MYCFFSRRLPLIHIFISFQTYTGTYIRPNTIQIHFRLDADVYELGVKNSKYTPSILRPCSSNTSQPHPDNTNIDYLTSNRFTNMEEVSNLMSNVCQAHQRSHPKCPGPQFAFPRATEKCQGLGTSVETVCLNCDFKMPHTPLFKKVSSKTKPSAEINVRLGQYMVNSEVSMSSVRCLLSILDCNAPSEKTLLRNMAKASHVHMELGHKQIQSNQEKLSQIIAHMPQDSAEKAIISCDTVYNNSARGGKRQPGTQSVTPFIEMTTEKQLIIDMECQSKICNKCGLTDSDSHEGCLKSYPGRGAMSRAEKIAAELFYEKVKAGPLSGKVTHFLADGSNQIMSGINDPSVEKIMCVQHLKRVQRRKFYKTVGLLKQDLFGRHDPWARKLQLGNNIVNRCSIELTRARRKHAGDDARFLSSCNEIRYNVLDCLSGSHTNCTKASFVCQPQKDHQITKCWALSTSDVNVLQSVVDYRLVNIYIIDIIGY